MRDLLSRFLEWLSDMLGLNEDNDQDVDEFERRLREDDRP